MSATTAAKTDAASCDTDQSSAGTDDHLLDTAATASNAVSPISLGHTPPAEPALQDWHFFNAPAEDDWLF